MDWLNLANLILTVVFFLCQYDQFLYIPIVWLRGGRREEFPCVPHDFAVLICARNEAEVVGDLIRCLHAQTYDQSLLHVFVLADNCTDDTAAVARAAGACVYTREDREHVGKGYALAELMRRLKEDYPAGFDGYFVFDADNLLAPDYIEQMNRTFSAGHEIVTGYRNSKNYGDNWISAGYALWFLRDCRYLNQARHILHTSCVISGTGFVFSRKIAEEMGDWPYHLLTEDVEFPVDQILKGRTIAYCPAAELFDEQPVTLAQSWRQRLRWARGYLQVLRRYGGRLLGKILRGSFACFDVMMMFTPAMVLSIVTVACDAVMLLWSVLHGGSLLAALADLGLLIAGMYLALFGIGVITAASERKRIRATTAKKLRYLFTFPLFIFTYVPISIAALFCRPGWKPIRHTRSVETLDPSGSGRK